MTKALMLIGLCLKFQLCLTYQPTLLVLVDAGQQEMKPELVVQTGHTGSANSVAFSPDGKLLASGSSDDTIRLWEVESGRELRTLEGHALSANSVAFSPDGKLLVSGNGDATLRLWEVESGKLLRTLEGHTKDVNTVTFSPDGKTLASGSHDGTVKLWEAESGRELRTLEGHTLPVLGVAFSPDGKLLASGSVDERIKLWEAWSGRLLHTLEGHTSTVASVMFSPDGKLLVSGSYDNTLRLWEVESGRELRMLEGHTVEVNAVAFSPDGKRLASGSDDKTVILWDVESGRELRTLGSRTYSVGAVPFVESVAFSPDGRTLASGCGNDIVKLWEVESGRELRTLAGHSFEVYSAAFSPDGKLLANGNNDLTVSLWDVASGQLLRTLGEHTPGAHIWRVRTVAFSPDGKTLASVSEKAIKLWDVASGRELRILAERMHFVRSVAFSPDGKLLASVSDEKTVKLWEVESGQPLRTLEGHTDGVALLGFSPDGRLLASGSNDTTVKLWEVESGRLTQSYSSDDPQTAVVVSALIPNFYRVSKNEPNSPDGKWQVKVGVNGRLDLYEVRTGELRASLIALDERDWLVVTPDGLFDGSPAAWRQIIWRFDNNTFNYAPVEAFFNEFYYPGLLQEIIAGKRPTPPDGKDIAKVDRRRPTLNVSLSGHQASAAPLTERTVTVKIDVADNTNKPALATHPSTGGARDVRLFRNGSLVKVWRGDVLRGRRNVTLEAIVPVVAGENHFTAYAFNRDNVKSSDAALTINGADSLKRAGTAYILAVGVNAYANPLYDLRFAVADAREFGAEFKRQQERLGQYAKVEVIPLYDKDATKANVMRALAGLAGRVQPEDAVVVYFAGHGTAYENRFYLIPHDLGYTGARESVDAAGLRLILEHSISDRELESAFEGVDAGQILFVIDACNSGQALEAEERRRGPMNSKGLAQLAYEKGMYILTAAQSFQAAQEASQLGHGLLTYALVEEGLKRAEADKEPTDGTVLAREWLDYATTRVPQMQVGKMRECRDVKRECAVVEGEEKIKEIEKRSVQVPRVFYRRELGAQAFVIAKPGAGALSAPPK